MKVWKKANFNGITSILTLLEILVKPKKENNSLLTERYKLLFETFPNLQVKTLDENIADVASSLRANYNINTPDAIQIATSLEAKADIFITNDTSLKKISEIKVLLLSEMLQKKGTTFSPPCQKDKNSVIWFYKENKMSNLFSVFSSTGRSADW